MARASIGEEIGVAYGSGVVLELLCYMLCYVFGDEPFCLIMYLLMWYGLNPI